MRIDINSEALDVPAGITVLALMDLLKFKPMGTVVERNGEIVDRDAFASTTVSEGDRLEVVRLVGGG